MEFEKLLTRKKKKISYVQFLGRLRLLELVEQLLRRLENAFILQLK